MYVFYLCKYLESMELKRWRGQNSQVKQSGVLQLCCIISCVPWEWPSTDSDSLDDYVSDDCTNSQLRTYGPCTYEEAKSFQVKFPHHHKLSPGEKICLGPTQSCCCRWLEDCYFMKSRLVIPAQAHTCSPVTQPPESRPTASWPPTPARSLRVTLLPVLVPSITLKLDLSILCYNFQSGFL